MRCMRLSRSSRSLCVLVVCAMSLIAVTTTLDVTRRVAVADSLPRLVMRDQVVGEAQGPAVVVVSLSAPSASTVTVNYLSALVTANNIDFSSVSGSLTFAPGETTKSVSVAITNDTVAENLESFTLGLSSVVNASIETPLVTVEIVDNDTLVSSPPVSVRDEVVDESAGTAVVPVILGAASASTITVGYTTVSGTATAGADFTAVTGTLTFGAGETAHNIVVPITDDAVAEQPETFTVVLSNPTNATILGGVSTVTIGLSDLAQVSLPRLVMRDQVVGEAQGPAVVVVSLSAPSASTVTVNYLSALVTANNIDFSSVSGSLTFAPGETTKSVSVAITNDTVAENLELFTLGLSSAVNASIETPLVTVEIVDNDTLVSSPPVSVRDEVVDESAGTAVVPVILGAASASTITVGYTTVSGTATAGADFTAVTGTLTFGAGETAHNIVVPITDDAVAEQPETFTVVLSNPTNATILGGVSTVTIGLSDLAQVSLPRLVMRDQVVGEAQGPAVVVVSLSAPSASTVTVNYLSALVTANNIDFSSVSGSLTFAPGETTKSVSVAITNDTVAENLELFTLGLSTR